MTKISAFLKLIRPINLVITIAVVIVASIICIGKINLSLDVILGAFAAAFVAAGGNIINDIFDLEIDKINRPKRPLPSNQITKKEAIYFYINMNIFSLIIGLKISFPAFLIILFTIILLFLYSYKAKGIPFIGNIIVAVCTALAFIYGGILVDIINDAIIPAIFAFLVNLIREMVKDIEDINGDEKNGILTIPIKFGITTSKKIIFLTSIILISVTFLPFIYGLYQIEYFIIVLFFVNLPIVYFLKELYNKNYLEKISNISLGFKIIMVFGLIAIYMGKM
ncbi:MAG: geranylgeranylglycerol-phosphate geranylgeranyltransferase [Ignavibacteriales bacterium]|nr:geranylgeranylglycerol-phosphate geranylgeranyltransferase [Ignavibacteriales bacterium]